MAALVTRKGQVTIPKELRQKYGIKEGTRIIFDDSSLGIVLKVVPKIQDLVGVDAGKVTVEKSLEALDKMRSNDRY